MGKHLFAKFVEGQVYRDELFWQMDDDAFHEILGRQTLPAGYVAYHYSSERQWEAVLKLPIYQGYEYQSVQTEVQILLSPHGACRRCMRVPADGLYQGRYPIINEITGALLRTSPYKGYICEQCAQTMEDESGVQGCWLPSYRHTPSQKKKGKKKV